MAELELPRTWGGKLVTAIRAVNEEVETLESGGPGVEVTHTLIGPLPISYQTADITEWDVTRIGPVIPAGVVIQEAWVTSGTSAWQTDPDDFVDNWLALNLIALVDVMDRENAITLKWYPLTADQVTSGDRLLLPEFVAPDLSSSKLGGRLLADAQLSVSINEGNWVSGEGDVFLRYSSPTSD